MEEKNEGKKLEEKNQRKKNGGKKWRKKIEGKIIGGKKIKGKIIGGKKMSIPSEGKKLEEKKIEENKLDEKCMPFEGWHFIRVYSGLWHHIFKHNNISTLHTNLDILLGIK